MASRMPSFLTTPMRKMREEQATKGAISKIAQPVQNAEAALKAETTLIYGKFSYLSNILKCLFPILCNLCLYVGQQR